MPADSSSERLDHILSCLPRATEARRFELLRALYVLLDDPHYLLTCRDDRTLEKCVEAFKIRGGMTAAGMITRLKNQRTNVRSMRKMLGLLQDPMVSLHRLDCECHTGWPDSACRISLADLPDAVKLRFQAERERQASMGWPGLLPFVSRLFDALSVVDGASKLRPLAEAVAWSLTGEERESPSLWGLFLYGEIGVAERIRLTVFHEGTGDVTFVATRVSESDEGKRFGVSIKHARWAAAHYLRRLSVDYDAVWLLSSDILLRIGERYHSPGYEGASLGLPIAVMLVAHALNLPLPQDTALTGQLTPEGHIHPVDGVREKIRAGAKIGLKRLIVPVGNMHEGPWSQPDGPDVFGVRSLDEACEMVFRDFLLQHGYQAFPLGAASHVMPMEPAAPLIGRQRNLVWFKQRLNRALSGYGRLIVLKGEAGIGKTRLLEEIQQYARDCGMRVLRGTCLSQHGPVPYLPIIDALTGFDCTEAGKDEMEPTGQIDAIKEVLERIHGAQHTDSTVLRVLRVQLYEHIVSFLTSRSQHAGILLSLEDAHWSDAGMIDLLYHIARRAADQRLCIVATYRPDEGTLRDSVEGRYFLETVQRCMEEGIAETLELEPLSETECRVLVSTLLQDRHVPVWMNEWMYQQTRGNPLFVVETIRWWRDQGWLQGGQLDWKDLEERIGQVAPRIQELIARRLGHLSVSEQELLEIAAVGGERFDVEDVIEICRAGRLNILRTIQRLDREYRLLRHIEGAVYGFSHGKIQEVLYGRIAPVLRTEYHTAWGRQLLDRKTDGQDISVEMLAMHLYYGGEPRDAVPYLMEAGDRSLKMCVFREAKRYWEKAKNLVENDDAASESYLKLLLNLGRVCYELGEWEVALKFNNEALSISQRLSDAASQAQALLQKGAVLIGRTEWVTAISIFKQSMEKYTSVGKILGVGTCHNYLGNIAYAQSDWNAAYEHYSISLETFNKCNDKFRLAITVGNLGNVIWSKGDTNAAVHFYEMSSRMHQEVSNYVGIAEMTINLGMVYERTEEWDKSLNYHHESVQLLEHLAHSRHLWNAYLNYARVLARTEAVSEAHHILMKAYAILGNLKNNRGMAEAKRVEGLIASVRNDWNRALVLFAESEALCLEVSDRYSYAETVRERALMFVRKGDISVGLAELSRAKTAFEKINSLGDARYIANRIEELTRPYNPA